MSFLNYSGPLYAKIGRKHIKLTQTAADVDAMTAQRDNLRTALQNLHTAVIARMSPDEPTDIDRLALYTAHKEAGSILKDIPEKN
jgi:predicted phage tail protein